MAMPISASAEQSGNERRHRAICATKATTDEQRHHRRNHRQSCSLLLDSSDVDKIVGRRLGTAEFRVSSWSLDMLGETNGFLGQYYTLSVTMEDGESLRFFAKTPPPTTSPQYDFLVRHNTFNKEIDVYDAEGGATALLAAAPQPLPRRESSSSDRPQGGTFTSPYYPKPYPSNIDCLLYTFIGQPDEIVKLTFHHFNIRRARSDCVGGDFLKVFLHLEGSGVSEYTPWSGVLCGDLRDVPQVLYSSRSTLILEFHTQESSSSNATGFFGNFHFIDRHLGKKEN